MTFRLQYGPSKLLWQEIRRRGLTILGQTDPQKHRSEPDVVEISFRIDSPPWWVMEIRPGSKLIWGNDPEFNRILREGFGQSPDLVRETSYSDLRYAHCFDRGPFSGRVKRDVWSIAQHLGAAQSDETAISFPGALLVADMIGIAIARDRREFFAPREIQINRGILRFLKAALELPACHRPGLDKLEVTLADQPSLLRLTRHQIGCATDQEAYWAARILAQSGFNVVLVGDDRAELPEEVARSDEWRSCLGALKRKFVSQRHEAQLGPWAQFCPAKPYRPKGLDQRTTAAASLTTEA